MEQPIGIIGKRVYDEAVADGTVSRSDHQLMHIFSNLVLAYVEGVDGDVNALHVNASQCLFNDAGFFAFLEILRRLVFALRDELERANRSLTEESDSCSGGAQPNPGLESLARLPQRLVAVRIELRNANLDNGRVLSLANAVDSLFPLHKVIVVDTIDLSGNIQVSTVGGKRLRRLRREYPFLRFVHVRDCALNTALLEQIEEFHGGCSVNHNKDVGDTTTQPAEQPQERRCEVEAEVPVRHVGVHVTGEVVIRSPEAALSSRSVLGDDDVRSAPNGGTPPTQPREPRRGRDGNSGDAEVPPTGLEQRLPSPPQFAKPPSSVVRRVFATDSNNTTTDETLTSVSGHNSSDAAHPPHREVTHTYDTNASLISGSTTLPYASSSESLKNPFELNSTPSSPKLFYVWNAGSYHRHRGGAAENEQPPPPPPTSPQEPLALLRRLYEATAPHRGQFWWTGLHHHESRATATNGGQHARLDRLMTYLSTSNQI